MPKVVISEEHKRKRSHVARFEIHKDYLKQYFSKDPNLTLTCKIPIHSPSAVQCDTVWYKLPSGYPVNNNRLRAHVYGNEDHLDHYLEWRSRNEHVFVNKTLPSFTYEPSTPTQSYSLNIDDEPPAKKVNALVSPTSSKKGTKTQKDVIVIGSLQPISDHPTKLAFTRFGKHFPETKNHTFKVHHLIVTSAEMYNSYRPSLIQLDQKSKVAAVIYVADVGTYEIRKFQLYV